MFHLFSFMKFTTKGRQPVPVPNEPATAAALSSSVGDMSEAALGERIPGYGLRRACADRVSSLNRSHNQLLMLLKVRAQYDASIASMVLGHMSRDNRKFERYYSQGPRDLDLVAGALLEVDQSERTKVRSRHL